MCANIKRPPEKVGTGFSSGGAKLAKRPPEKVGTGFSSGGARLALNK
jgi:hypothetical protein